jgi:beta-glucanase (GH16 family)
MMTRPLILSATGLLSLAACLAESTPDEEYKLVWADEFDKIGKPDPANWVYEQGFVRNRELQWYQPENASCKSGRLVIEGREERQRNPNFQKGSGDWKKSRPFAEYTAACLTTRGLHSWQYGRFEVKARIKVQDGLWPAIWFLGVDGEWPSCGEIDLMEAYDGSLMANACWGSNKRGTPTWDSSKTPVTSFNDPSWDKKYHVWRMDWDSESIKLFVDDQLLNTIDLTQTVNPLELGPKNPFHQPHYLLLNLAIGGDNGGDPSGTRFPTKYEIEYVRVYQKQPSGGGQEEAP